MPSDLLCCRECGATLEYTTQMEHWDWHRTQRARLSELERRIEALEQEPTFDGGGEEREA